DGGKEYSIGYVLNGGILPEDSAEKYTEGEYASLPLPSKTGAVFCGWFEDPELTEPLGAILPSRSGDITLYASFSEPVTGKRASMNISGYSESYRYPIAGTAVYDYISFADGGYYVREYSSLSGYVTQNRDESSWRSFIYDSDSVYAGNKILNGNYFGTGNGSYTCQIWTSGADTFYVYNSVYLLEKETITPSYRYTAVMNSFEDASFDYSFKPDVIVWYGTSAEVPETAEIGKPLTLTASGDCFAGWYSGGVKITDSRTLEIGKADPETAYECCSSMEPFKDFESFYALADYQVRYPVIVADHVGNVIYSGNSHYSADYPGLYTITESSEGTRHAFRILIEGSKSSLFSWNYGGNYSITLEQNSGNVFSYPAEKSCRSGNIDDYFTLNSPDIRDLAAKLAPYKTDMNDREFAEFVLKFVQSIPASGNTAWKYPSETLWDKSGSSSDRSILYVTIMRALGYDTAVAVSDGPVISCIALKPSKTDTVVSHGGKSYIFAAVSGDYGIGGTADLPSGLAVIPVTAEPESVPDVTGNEYSVTYVLNGGTLPGYAASSYIAGKYAELPLPENGDKFFEGWYKDALCTVPAGAILPSDSGDLTLYASWTDELTGKGFESEVTGKSTSVIFSRQYSGTASWKYLAFSGGAYYIERYTSVSARTFFGFGNSSLINETDYYWTDEGGEEKFYYRGNADVKSSVFGTVTCEIWESEDSVEYVYRSFYPLVIETESSGIRFTYTLSRTLEFEPETEFVPTVYAEYGISVDMPPVVKIGESFALAASGAQFSGWYRNGTLATDSLVLTEDRATPDTKYEARSSSEPLIYNEKTIFFEDFGLKSPVTITDENGREYVRSTSATF
ncbi:MAG: InlB B-repeat-containing protein, partial [Candidatus Methanomethylophilaceae archaeon]|nr:InlB B-repeat-containing protein [Candidatus Methanomethylophilaceae archaeon]